MICYKFNRSSIYYLSAQNPVKQNFQENIPRIFFLDTVSISYLHYNIKNSTTKTSRKFQISQNFNYGLNDHTGLRTPIILRASPAAMFSIPTLYPLHHVKMDKNKRKTLCTTHRKHSNYNSQTLSCVACHQSISTNKQIATSHFTFQFQSPRNKILFQQQTMAKLTLNSPHN